MADTSSPMLAFEEAFAVVLRTVPLLPAVEVELSAAVGRTLAASVAADGDFPPFDKSAMDGYAVRHADVVRTPVELAVVEQIPAGKLPQRAVGAGQCARIMTGAPLPEDADAVVMIEYSETLGEERVRLLRSVGAGENVCRRGEDLKRGEVAVAAGTVIRPVEVALLAAVGCTRVSVRALPRVAIVATGDEVVEADQTPRPGQIRNSNSPLLAARLQQAGFAAEFLGIAGDEAGALKRTLEEGLTRDVLLVSGGVSMGDYDLVPQALAELGVELLFQSVAIKPGRPTVFGRRGKALIFGIPGNPVSNLLIVELFVVPALRRMCGQADPGPRFVEAMLEGTIAHKGNRASHVPVKLATVDGAWRAWPVEYHGSADLAGAARGNAFAVVPAGVKQLNAGARTRVLVL